MTEEHAQEKAVDLDQCYRLLLHATDPARGDAALIAEIQWRFAACEEEFAGLLQEHPRLFEHLKKRHQLAYNFDPTAEDLIAFAWEQDLDLFGVPTRAPQFVAPE